MPDTVHRAVATIETWDGGKMFLNTQNVFKVFAKHFKTSKKLAIQFFLDFKILQKNFDS